MIRYTYPNAIMILYNPYQHGSYRGRDARLNYTSKPGGVVFAGTYYEAQEYFRNLYPSKSLNFSTSTKTHGN